ncbi:MAG: hypothetical protein U1E62_05315 [Alsobacter sp.]
MSAQLLRDLSYSTCFICGDPGAGLGFSPSDEFKVRPKWLCDDPLCLGSARKAYDMSSSHRTAQALEARDKGGEAAGAYLEEIGKTDIGELTLEEWREFLDRFVRARADHLRRLAASFAPPF